MAFAQTPSAAGPLDGVLLGRWTYRSFRNNPTQGTPAADLLFGEGTMTITSAHDGRLEATFDFGPGYQMKCVGSVTYGNPPTLQFEGKGVGESNQDWLYDYTGYLGYEFPQAVGQKPSLVGTIVRAKPHSGGQAPAGVTGSWIAVKQTGVETTSIALMAGDVQQLRAGATPPKEHSAATVKMYLDDTASRAAHPLPLSVPKVLKAPAGAVNQLMSVAAAVELPPVVLPTQASLQPTTVSSTNGRLVLDLVMDYNKSQLMIGKDKVRLRTYNGQLVGPVMRAKAGDTLSITVHNNLPDVPPPSPDFMNGHHDWNVSNLHFHGLHVAPQGTKEAESDNVLLEILPGQSQHYEVHIPADHPAGTFWYHSHRHGSTSAQVASGMAGALIIDRDDRTNNLDSIPEVAAAAQEVMVFQAVPYLINATNGIGEVELYKTSSGTSADEMFGPDQFFKLKRYITVNGLKIPTITIAPGEVRHLRLVASGQRELLQLRIARDADGNVPQDQRIMFNEVATDGLVTGRLAQSQDLVLYPGYRSDALIQVPANASGTYYMVDMNSVSQAPGATGADGSPERVSIVAKIVIAGSATNMQLPKPAALLTQRLPDLRDATNLFTRYAYYGIVIPDSSTVDYFLSEDNIPPGIAPPGREFNPAETRYLPLGHIERWEVGSRNSQGIGVAHPFHIHINPFLISKVTDADGRDVLEQEFGGTIWRDTLAMKQGYTYTLLTHYTDFIGSFVDHCHILDHEDNGMMEKVTIYRESLAADSAPLGAARPSPAGTLPAVLRTAAGRPALAVVLRSVGCAGCRDQIKAFEKAARSPGWPKDLDLIFVSPDSTEILQTARAQGLVNKGKLVSDPDNTTLNFIDPKAKSENRPHGILLLDGNGATLHKSSSKEPLVDPGALQNALAPLASPAAALAAPGPSGGGGPRVSIAVWNTPSPDDDYVTWAPTPCTIRLNSPEAQDVTVTLTNDPEGAIPSGRTIPLDGDVVFAANVAQGQTARESSLTLRLPRDGSPVSFYIAGKFPRASTKDKDCVIEIHDGPATGAIIGSHALMVRVRKDHRTLTEFERQRFLEALDYLHRTAVAPEGGDMYMHFVRMHKAAAFGIFYDPGQAEPQYPWPDLSHKGPGFIAWHRAFLLEFERALQEKYPDVALPYWTMSDPSTLFTPDFMGANDVNGKGSTPAIFSASNPLYGWTADIDGVTNQQVMRRGYGRNPGDPKFGPFLTDNDLFKLDHFSFYPLGVDTGNIDNPDNSFAAMLEMNPHNVGHNWIGPWMANCQTSPRDPIFWVFHAGFDRQWAKWQVLKNRFNPDGSGDSFCPLGTFEAPGQLCGPQVSPTFDCDTLDPNACVPVNHHLADQLWPWNEKFGKGAHVKSSYPEEAMATPFLKPFPAAPIPGLFPASPQAVACSDMIDFMGKTSGRLQMGFCYDDTPFEVIAATPERPLVAAAESAPQSNVLLNPQKEGSLLFNADAPARARELTMLHSLRDNTAADLESRRSALRILTERGETDLAFKIARSMEPADAPLRPEAIRLIEEFVMFNPEGLKRRNEMMEILEKDLLAPDQETRSEVLWALAGPEAPKELLQALRESLSGGAGAKFPVEEAIQGLTASGAAGQVADLIRPSLESKNPAEQAAAAAALTTDQASVGARIRLARNRLEPKSVRTAALQSLNPADGAQFTQVLSIATDAGQDGALRGDAIALIGVWARSSQLPLSSAQLSSAREALAGMTESGGTGLETAISRTLRSLGKRLKAVK